jgi:hypothetical protein
MAILLQLVEGPFLGEKLIPNQGKMVWKKSGIFFPIMCGSPVYRG